MLDGTIAICGRFAALEDSEVAEEQRIRECLLRASECRAMADTIASREEKAPWLRLAAEWDHLAAYLRNERDGDADDADDDRTQDERNDEGDGGQGVGDPANTHH